MSFTAANLTHVFLNGDATPAAGSVTAILSGRMTNSGATIMPSEVTATLDGSGALSITLTSTMDAATIQTNVQWVLTIRLTGLPAETFTINVPAGGGTIDLGTLLPGTPQVG